MIYLLLALTPEIEKFTVKDLLPRKWTKKDIPIAQQEKIELENAQVPIDIDLVPHKFFELFLDDEVINHLCEQSKIHANRNGNFTFRFTLDEFRAFLSALVISGYIFVPRRRMYWEQAPDLFNGALSRLLTQNRFREILRYINLADNAELIQDDN